MSFFASKSSSSGWRAPSLAKALGAAVAALGLASLTSLAPGVEAGRAAGQYETVLDNSLASAMMMALIDENNVMILDKTEGNRARTADNKPVWGAIMSLADNTPRALELISNPFCASGFTLGNGSWVVVGGNNPVGYGGATVQPTNVYGDYDGRTAIRIMDPNTDSSKLFWNDNSSFMDSQRWYPGVEVLADGSAIILGGSTTGGFINRNYPNVDPAFSTQSQGSLQNLLAGAANPTWEFFPSKGNARAVNNFMVTTSGLNMYPHMYLMPSGLMFMQANYSTTLWNYTSGDENNAYHNLDDMPGQIVRVYPASGATAMLPLTPANKYTPTILFCGGTYMTDEQWGDYTSPKIDPQQVSASDDCSSITPEDADGNFVSGSYTTEDKLPQGRSMGQFIHLPDGTMVIVNGAEKGVAGYTNQSWNLIPMPYNVSAEGMAQSPTYMPVLYDPSQPKGSRISQKGFQNSPIARLYHSSAILIPDGSVLVAGSNPHQDVAITMPTGTTPQAFNTTYEVEKWYPPYYFETRPEPQGLPSYLLYGGDNWNFTMDSKFMGSSANYKAENTKVMVIRPGFSTHAMNMGQRSLQLAHTYTVNDDGSVSYMVNPMPLNKNIFVPGPALLFITIDGVPSRGVQIMIGSKTSGAQIPQNFATGAAPQTLPAGVNNSKYTAVPSKDGTSFGIAKIVGIAVGAAAVIALIVLGLCCWRRRSNKGPQKVGAPSTSHNASGGAMYGMGSYTMGGGNEYKRVNTPVMGVHEQARGSMGTFDSYRMQDVNTPASPYYDSPATTPGQPGGRRGGPSPLAHGGEYQQHGWGEHQSGGDVGEQYYNNSAYTDPNRFYDTPQHGSNQYSSQGSYGGRNDYFRQ